MKHTKGQWKIESDNNWECLVYTENDIHWFEIYNKDIDGFEEMQANAKLIAAAPEMLSTLIDISNGIGKGVSASKIQEMTLKAIKKATE